MPNIRHSFINAKSDGGDATVTRPSDWNANLQYTNASGAPSGTAAFIREVLTANRTYYVRTDGSDINTGLVNNAGGAFLTLQKPYDVICQTLDLAGYTVTVQIGDGTYTVGINANKGWSGGGSIAFQGNATTPSNVLLNLGSDDGLDVSFPHVGTLAISDLKIVGASGIKATSAVAIYFSGIEFGACSVAMFNIDNPCAFAICYGAWKITGGTPYVFYAGSGAKIQVAGITCTITGSLAWTYTAFSRGGSFIDASSAVFSGGTITGTRYLADQNAVINTSGGGANFFPGSIAGSVATGGQYV